MANVGKAEYEVIDTDPHFGRVVRSFRPLDYATWALFAASGPAYLLGASYVQSRGQKVHASPRFLRYAFGLGLVAGFLDRYAVSALRFQGHRENAREVLLDREYRRQAQASNTDPYLGDGENLLPQWLRGVAARNSLFANVNLALIPWFNLVRHEYHGENEK